MRGHQPGAGQIGRADARAPAAPFQRVERCGLLHIFQRDLPVRHRRGAGGGRGGAGRGIGQAAILRLRLRIHRDVHVLQQLPLGLRPAPRQRLGEGVARRACLAHIVVGDGGFVDNAMFGQVHDRARLLRRQPVEIGEIAHDRARFAGRHLQPVEAHHPLDRLRPALRRGAHPGDARQIALRIGRVAGAALLACQRVGDGDALLGLALCGVGRGRGGGIADIGVRHRDHRRAQPQQDEPLAPATRRGAVGNNRIRWNRHARSVPLDVSGSEAPRSPPDKDCTTVQYSSSVLCGCEMRACHPRAEP
jgi:hypothetical protein